MKRLFAHVTRETQGEIHRERERDRYEFALQAHFLYSPPHPSRPFAAVVYNRISHPSHPVGNVAFALFFCPCYLFILLSFFFSVTNIDKIYECVCVCVYRWACCVLAQCCFIENIKNSFIMGVQRKRKRQREGALVNCNC